MSNSSIKQSDAHIQCVSSIEEQDFIKNHLGIITIYPMATKRRKYIALGCSKIKSIFHSLKKGEGLE